MTFKIIIAFLIVIKPKHTANYIYGTVKAGAKVVAKADFVYYTDCLFIN